MKKRQIEGYYCNDRKSGLAKALELIPKGASVGWGGSMTLIEIGLLDAIKAGDYKIINRDKVQDGEIYCSDFFLMSNFRW